MGHWNNALFIQKVLWQIAQFSLCVNEAVSYPHSLACGFDQVYILEELLSPIITPFILLFCVRPRAANIVDFLRMFTVQVVGVGDICSFAEMDVRKHGNSKVGAFTCVLVQVCIVCQFVCVCVRACLCVCLTHLARDQPLPFRYKIPCEGK